MATKTEVDNKKHDVQIALLDQISAWIEAAETNKAAEGVAELALAYRYLDGGMQPGGTGAA